MIAVVAASSACLAVALLALLLRLLLRPHKKASLAGKHCIVTGGSSGIGLETAKTLASKGAIVTIMARNIDRMEKAVGEIRACAPDPERSSIGFVACDIASDYASAQSGIEMAEAKGGPCYALFHIAGTALPLPLREYPVEKIDELVRINLLSTIYCAKAVMAGMMKRGEGRILLTSSGAGLVGSYGYTVYGATKFGVRGFAEALQMELKTHGIAVSVALPPDTETPGFEAENLVKNEVIHKISADGGLFKPNQVAIDIVKGVENGNFLISTGFDMWLLAQLTAGFSPANSVIQLLSSVVAKPILRIVSLFYNFRWYGLVHDYEQKRSQPSTDQDRKRK
jgi:3-dehydrosphinganine reductase